MGGKGLQSRSHPMYGLGYGLPLSRLYVRYFHGDMKVISVDGHATTVYIYLQSIPDDATELLPVFSQAAVNKLAKTTTKVSDWTA